ncbi:class I SAM-dependent methyltransferase [Geothrix sp.]|uniref:class I SAM-dependent methyltransferase n=1 Tax=Geothrix sp. TaxID=1962974 RepID=UPI0025C6D561|nr:class I SAM-dependent methyltransferase [Geothrix sp.]
MPDRDVHQLEWDEETIRRFWDFAATRESWQEDYFSYQSGTGIVGVLKALTPLAGRVLDYGCGPGYLVERLLAMGVGCEGADLSEATVAAANQRLGEHPLWRGARVIDPVFSDEREGLLDLVICVETIEHLLPPGLPSILQRLCRMLKPGSGRLFITTPHAEDLARAQVFCPECGSVFHRYQHLSQFTKASLTELMEREGFSTLACEATDFARFQEPLLRGPLEWSPRYILKTLLRAGAASGDALHLPGRPKGGLAFARRVGSGPHLFWLGQRR